MSGRSISEEKLLTTLPLLGTPTLMKRLSRYYEMELQQFGGSRLDSPHLHAKDEQRNVCCHLQQERGDGTAVIATRLRVRCAASPLSKERVECCRQPITLWPRIEPDPCQNELHVRCCPLSTKVLRKSHRSFTQNSNECEGLEAISLSLGTSSGRP